MLRFAVIRAIEIVWKTVTGRLPTLLPMLRVLIAKNERREVSSFIRHSDAP